MYKKLHFIINPISGKPQPILNTIASVCAQHKCEWSVSVMQLDNIDELCKEAKNSKAEAIIVYGGDGTVSSIAKALVNTDKILGIIPGGTANIVSKELNISSNIQEACEDFFSDSISTKKIDIALVGKQCFLSRLGIGFEADMIKGADRESKTKLGWFAYAISALKSTFSSRLTKYNMIIDGKKVTCKGLSMIVANSGNLGAGLQHLNLFSHVDIEDGFLDVIVVRPSDLKFFSSNKKFKEKDLSPIKMFQQWKAKEIIIKSGHKQGIQYDGEVLKAQELDIKVVAKGLNVIVKNP